VPTDPTNSNPVPPDPPELANDAPSANIPQRRRLAPLPRIAITTAAAIAILALGVGIGSFAPHGGRTPAYAPRPPVAITAMPDWSNVEIKGQVAEIFGNKFVLEDASGRALVETGRQGEDAALVQKDEPVTVQGRFEHGFVHAEFIVHGDGKIVALQPPHGHPPHGPLDWLRGHHVGAAPLLAPPRATA
jgi:uncharacterized protein YdeI (BOF family)